jgi:hypothetical protein
MTIYKLDLDPINALIVPIDGKLPYFRKDAAHVSKYVKRGGGLYLAVTSGGLYGDSVRGFLGTFGLKDLDEIVAKYPGLLAPRGRPRR